MVAQNALAGKGLIDCGAVLRCRLVYNSGKLWMLAMQVAHFANIENTIAVNHSQRSDYNERNLRHKRH